MKKNKAVEGVECNMAGAGVDVCGQKRIEFGQNPD